MNVSVLISTFLAATIEVIEMVVIVVAVGVTRSWRAARLGALAALVLLAVLIAVLGAALQDVPLRPLRLVVGALLLPFGSQWLRKGILFVSRGGWLGKVDAQVGIYRLSGTRLRNKLFSMKEIRRKAPCLNRQSSGRGGKRTRPT